MTMAIQTAEYGLAILADGRQRGSTDAPVVMERYTCTSLRSSKKIQGGQLHVAVELGRKVIF